MLSSAQRHRRLFLIPVAVTLLSTGVLVWRQMIVWRQVIVDRLPPSSISVAATVDARPPPSSSRHSSLQSISDGDAFSHQLSPSSPQQQHTPLLYYGGAGRLRCDQLFAGNVTAIKEAKAFRFDVRRVRLLMKYTNDSCGTFQELFNFHRAPLSQEEAAFPLAYGMLVYQHIVQVLLELKSIYQPQNVYMIAVSDVSENAVWSTLKRLERCLPNVRVFLVPKVKWCGPGILTSSMETLRRLTQLNHPWKYFQASLRSSNSYKQKQFLSGTDVPLKTNLETVRILKALNGSFNQEFTRFQPHRLRKRRLEDAPIRPLYKTMISVVLPRHMADWIMRSDRVSRMIVYLNKTLCADESFWGTVLFNGPRLDLPGGVDGEAWETRVNEIRDERNKKGEKRTVKPWPRPMPDPPGVYSVVPVKESFTGGYIVRFQLWGTDKRLECHGRWSHGSCVFGVGDLPMLQRQMALHVHKMYIESQSAAPICLWQEIERRANERPHFDASPYRELPLVKHHDGVPIDRINIMPPTGKDKRWKRKRKKKLEEESYEYVNNY